MLEEPEFWVAIGFILFVIGAARPGMRAITGALDRRAERIKASIDEAAKLRSEAQALFNEYQRKQRDSMREAEEIIAAARAEAERMRAQAVVDLAAAVKRREQQAIDKIAEAEAEATAQVRAAAAEIAIAAARDLIARNLPPDRARKLIDDAIQELPRKLN
jgi:F-type H+-transporting ATPase subunit b